MIILIVLERCGRYRLFGADLRHDFKQQSAAPGTPHLWRLALMPICPQTPKSKTVDYNTMHRLTFPGSDLRRLITSGPSSSGGDPTALKG